MNTLQGKKGYLVYSICLVLSCLRLAKRNRTRNRSRVLYNAKYLFELRIKFTNTDFY